jgi:XTP/dITP diphosphohydrolase
MKLVLATKNLNKLKEFKNLFENENIEVLSLNDFPDLPDVIEDQDTFEGNALKKAQEIFEFTGITPLADDSGLKVDYLNGEPAVYSARFAGEKATAQENNEKLLGLLTGVKSEARTAQFVCTLALVGENIKEIAVGVCEGIILTEYKGSNGFGYDPLFFYEPLQKTFAELSKDEKNSVSHRAIAFQKMKIIIDNKFSHR